MRSGILNILEMKKFMICILILFLCFSCSQKQEKVKRITEDGVEVIINHLEPYQIKGEPNKLSLEHLFTMDMEDELILDLGLTDIRLFDVDSQGNIFVFQSPNEDEPIAFKFDSNGLFKMSFGQMGPGPNEIQYPRYLGLNSCDEILILDQAKNKIIFFNTNGDRLKEIPIDLIYRPQRGMTLLPNGGYLIHRLPLSPDGTVSLVHLDIFDSEFNKISTLDKYQMNPDKMSVFLDNVPVVGVSKGSIYLGYGEKNKDISVYDLNGELKRKIRKEYKSVTVPAKLKQELEKQFERMPSLADKVYIPKYMPYFQYFFTDDEGRLYVVTSEIDEETGAHICDIYNSEGIFIERKAIGYFDLIKFIYVNEPLDIIAKNNRLYCMREKESGFEELLVYEMRWE